MHQPTDEQKLKIIELAMMGYTAAPDLVVCLMDMFILVHPNNVDSYGFTTEGEIIHNPEGFTVVSLIKEEHQMPDILDISPN